jgi:N-methylhydantoinase A
MDIGRDYLRSYLYRANNTDVDAMNGLFDDMLKEAMADFDDFNVSHADIVLEKSVDARYAGQLHMLEVKLPNTAIGKNDVENLIQEFHKKHKEHYTFSLPWVPVELRNLRLTAKIKSAGIPLNKRPVDGADASKALINKRRCYFNSRWLETPIYDGTKLESGNLVSGNAIIEEATKTTVIPEGYTCRVDEYGDFIVSKND